MSPTTIENCEPSGYQKEKKGKENLKNRLQERSISSLLSAYVMTPPAQIRTTIRRARPSEKPAVLQ